MRHIEPKPTTYLAAVLACENGGPDLGNPPPYAAACDAEKLIRLGKRAARIAKQRCNGIQRYDAKARQTLATWTDDDEARAEKATAKVEADARAILEPYGASDIKAHGDPRGFVLTFRLASGRSNSMDQNRWGV